MWLEDSCDGVIVNASIVRAGKRNSARMLPTQFRCGASKDVIKALLEEM